MLSAAAAWGIKALPNSSSRVRSQVIVERVKPQPLRAFSINLPQLLR